MQLDKKVWDYEKQRLQMVREQIQTGLEHCEDKIISSRSSLKEINKNMLSEFKFETDSTLNLEGAATMHHYQSMGQEIESAMKYQTGRQWELGRLDESAYFAKIVFEEEGEEPEEIYIGSSSLVKKGGFDYLIYDWRAPICSIFYDYEKGEVSYEAPGGLIKGNLTGKRHFKIKKDNIVYMFDSNINIMDDMLKEALSKSVNDKMSTIITTIQKEQNQVIRDTEADVLVVSGSAGSGKTSIALHRIAYLLYRNRQKVTPQDIMIFTPNDIFSDYISHVLPELGEQNVNAVTFNDYIMEFISEMVHKDKPLPTQQDSDNAYEQSRVDLYEDEPSRPAEVVDQQGGAVFTHQLMKVESYYSQMEYLLSPIKDEAFEERVDSMVRKSAAEFFDRLDEYLNRLERETAFITDIKYKGMLIISAEDIRKAYMDSVGIVKYSSRLIQVRNRVMSLLKDVREKVAYEYKQSLINADEYYTDHDMKVKTKRYVKRQFKGLYRHVRRMTRLDYIEVYNDFLAEEGLKTLDADAHFEDALCLAYIKGRLEPIRDVQKVKHLVIDEAQDYTLLHYKIISLIFGHCKYTLLGDPNQAIHPYISSRVTGDIEDFLGEQPRHIRLTKTYRSTRQISGFCQKILPSALEVTNVARDGKAPVVESYAADESPVMNRVVEQVKTLQETSYRSIAIIGKNKAHCDMLYQQLNHEQQVEIGLLNHEDQLYKNGVIIIPSFLAKGLEFDGVVVVCDDVYTYDEERERHLFYTVCTRALHDLTILYETQKPKLLP